MTTLMDRVKCTDFLSTPEPSQLELILSIQALRVEGIKNAKKPKKRKAKAKKGKIGKTRKPSITREQKALKAIMKLSPAQFALIQKKLK